MVQHLKMIPFTKKIGPYEMQEIALFDARDISEESAREAIQTERYNPFIVVMDIEQYDNVFRELRDILKNF